MAQGTFAETNSRGSGKEPQSTTANVDNEHGRIDHMGFFPRYTCTGTPVFQAAKMVLNSRNTFKSSRLAEVPECSAKPPDRQAMRRLAACVISVATVVRQFWLDFGVTR